MTFLHDLPIADLIAHYGYLAIFAIVHAGERRGLPLPGETVLLTAAAYAGGTGNINIAVVVAIAAAAAILGDNAGYWVGRRWGLPLLLRKGHLIGLDHGRLKLGQYLFRQHGGKIVFFGRFTAMLRAYARRARRREQTRCPPLHGLQRLRWCSLGLDHGCLVPTYAALDREHHGAGRAESARPRPHRRCGAVAVHAPARSTPHGRRRGRDPGSARRRPDQDTLMLATSRAESWGSPADQNSPAQQAFKSRWKRSSDSARPNHSGRYRGEG